MKPWWADQPPEDHLLLKLYPDPEVLIHYREAIERRNDLARLIEAAVDSANLFEAIRVIFREQLPAQKTARLDSVIEQLDRALDPYGDHITGLRPEDQEGQEP